MNYCLNASCAGCPEWVVSLAFIGGVVVYAFTVWLAYKIIKEILGDIEFGAILLLAIFWPLALVGCVAYGIVWYIIRLISMPVVGADKEDLRRMENKLEDQIDSGDNKVRNYVRNFVEDYEPPKSVKKPRKKAAKKASKKTKK